jgi:hypothetical protein
MIRDTDETAATLARTRHEMTTAADGAPALIDGADGRSETPNPSIVGVRFDEDLTDDVSRPEDLTPVR